MKNKIEKYLRASFTFKVTGLGEVTATYNRLAALWTVTCIMPRDAITQTKYRWDRPEARSRQVESKTRAAQIVHEFLTKYQHEKGNAEKG